MPYIGLVQLIGKYIFLAGLYLFLYWIFRELFRSLKTETVPPVRAARPAMPGRPPIEKRPRMNAAAPVKTRDDGVDANLEGSSAVEAEPKATPPIDARPALLRDVAPSEAPSPKAETTAGTMPAQREPKRVTPSRASSHSTAAQLIVRDPGDAGMEKGQEFVLTAAVTIGRSGENAIVINDRFASSRHALIFLKDGQRVLRDRNSTNGTFRNGHRIRDEVVLADGDTLRIGTVTFDYGMHP